MGCLVRLNSRRCLWIVIESACTELFLCIGVLLAVVFLRKVGIVGHKKGDGDEKDEKATHGAPVNRDLEAVSPLS